MSTEHEPDGQPDPVDLLRQEIAVLARRVYRSDAQVRQLAQRITEPSPAQGADDEASKVLPCWLVIEDWHRGSALMTELTDWVAQVWLRYPDSRLPVCWAWHPDVVEELWWCRNAWCDAYSGDEPTWAKVGDWHDRMRPNMATRLRAVSCWMDHHIGHSGDPAPAAPLLDAVAQVVTAWAAPNRPGWPLEPTEQHLADAAALQAARDTIPLLKKLRR